MTIFVGDDWAEDHHDIHVMRENGDKIVSQRLPEGLDGIRRFHELIGAHISDPVDVIVGIETDRGMWVRSLIASGYQVYAINPLSVSRYRDRHNVAGAKSDPGDAKLLADLVRTDRHNHREIAGDSDDVEALKVLARAHQNLIWTRQEHTNRVRDSLLQYFPGALVAFEDLSDRDCVAVLTKGSTPALAKALKTTQISRLLAAGGRKRFLERRALEIREAFQTEQLQTATALSEAFGITTSSTIQIIGAINQQIAQLETVLADRFKEHPDADIYLSMPGVGCVLGARVLAEFGDDPDRYDNVKSRRNYAGTSPLTIASGRKRVVTARTIRNRRLYNAIDTWAFCAITNSPGCRLFYDQHRAAGDVHHQALRALANRLIGILHGCLKTRSSYNENTAWAHRQPKTA
jgi:transposase